MSLKYGSSSRFASAESFAYASVIFCRKRARMMQPARKIFAIVPRSRFQPYSSDAVRSCAKPCAYEITLLRYSARRTASTNAARSPSNGAADGPDRTLLAATRSVFSDDSTRANTDSVISGSGTPRSSAFWLVHLPVPFCAARSRITSTRCLPVSSSFLPKIFDVISIR